jgi:hypothetical protein
MPAPKPFQFNSGAPGSGAQVGGYNNAMAQLQNSLNASKNTTSSQQMQLGQQLQNNQSQIGQSLTNRGLGNTTVANTMQQAPLQTYNMGMAQVGNQDALRQMSAYNNLAQMSAQGGQQISQMAQPYAQSQYQMNMLQNMQNMQPTINTQSQPTQQALAGMSPGAFGQGLSAQQRAQVAPYMLGAPGTAY